MKYGEDGYKNNGDRSTSDEPDKVGAPPWGRRLVNVFEIGLHRLLHVFRGVYSDQEKTVTNDLSTCSR